ncbi:hypothetical protein [Tessaracoccus caeni]|uniref:hypothetical protein n=1 Tax=Tessaracoccus caeni TaxID=3031239 RepID=UPI0023DB78CD|nr:hypothetical protein [Tessaracoccus caeni]MDF1488955.1 hypothetical protein [Tessaracoccus caeni]
MTRQGQDSRVKLAAKTLALAVATALVLTVSAVLPARANPAEFPFALSAKLLSGYQFALGDTVKIRFTAKNTSKNAIEVPEDAKLALTFAGAQASPQLKASGGFERSGFGEDGVAYAYYDFAKELPSTIEAGQSFSTTITYVTGKNESNSSITDVKNGGVFATFGYTPSGNYWEDMEEYHFITVPAKGKSDPSIKGTAQYGKKLTVDTGYTGPWNDSFEYQWYRNDKPISGATKKSYTLKKDDIGKKLAVVVTAIAANESWALFDTGETKTVALATLKTATPKISGTAKVGKTLKAKAGSWGPSTVKLSYQWYRDGAKIKGATKSSYKLTSKDKSKKITVKVTGKKSNYKTVTKTSKATKKVAK